MSASVKKNQKKTIKPSSNGSSGISQSKSYRISPESKEEFEKRKAKLKKLTLKVFQTAYENHQSQKA